MIPSGTISEILNQKGTNVWSISPEATVFEAIQFMAEKNIGALLVVQRGSLIGILSERDYTRKVALRGKSSRQTAVKEIISGRVISVTSCHTVEDCMRTMTENRIRHLPVVDDTGHLVGLISIGDLNAHQAADQEQTIHIMHEYLYGRV